MEDCWLAVQPLVRSQTLTHHHKLASQQCLWTASITVPAKYETYLPRHYSSRRTKTTSAGFWREQLPIISELPWRAQKFAILATVWGKYLLWWNTGVEGTAGSLSGQAQARNKFCQARIHLGHLRKPRELQLSSKQQFFECLSPTPLLKCCNSRILQYISRLETRFQYIWYTNLYICEMSKIE